LLLSGKLLQFAKDLFDEPLPNRKAWLINQIGGKIDISIISAKKLN